VRVVATPSDLLAWNVRRLREAAGLTQGELGIRLGGEGGTTRSQAAVAALEHGRRGVALDDLLALAKVFDVPPISLLAARSSNDEAAIRAGKDTLSVEEWHALLRIDEADADALRMAKASARKKTTGMGSRRNERMMLRVRERALLDRSRYPGPTFVSDTARSVAVPIGFMDATAELKLRPNQPYVARDEPEARALKLEAESGSIRQIDRFEARRLRQAPAKRRQR
jgi:transcriptional regulator with XRE-family HTH domain